MPFAAYSLHPTESAVNRGLWMRYLKQYIDLKIYKYLPTLSFNDYMDLTPDKVEVLFSMVTAMMDREIAENERIQAKLKEKEQSNQNSIPPNIAEFFRSLNGK